MTAPCETVDDTLIDAAEQVRRIRTEITKAMVGQSEVIDQVLVTLLAAGHALIEGVPGLGKTLLARALTQAFDGTTNRVQFTPDLMPADVLGHAMYDMKSGEMRTRRGPVFTHLLLADEINRAPAKTQAALLEVMQEHQVTLDGESIPVPRPFMTLATQNPIEQDGTYPLPEAQLDRFLVKILIDYPDERAEIELAQKVCEGELADRLNTDAVEPVVDPKGIGRLQEITTRVRVDPRIFEYAVRITRATRDRSGVSLGAGPRGGLALIRCARAYALLEQRSFVTPDDIKAVALPSLRHRVQLAAEFEIEGRTTDDVIESVLDDVEAPRL